MGIEITKAIQALKSFHQMTLDDQRTFGDWNPQLAQSKFFEHDGRFHRLDLERAKQGLIYTLNNGDWLSINMIDDETVRISII